MYAISRARQGGATRLELAVSTSLAALLAGVLLNSVISYQGETELVAAKQLVGSLRTALAIRSARALADSGEPALLALAQQNPMTWLQDRPQNYLGEYYSPNKSDLPPGNWYFDRAFNTLVYLPSAEKSFSSGIQKILLFKVKLARVSGPPEADGREEGTAGLVLDQVSDQSVVVHTIAGSVPRPNFSEKK
jgi:type II secretory pathway pseudopilin PulG